MDLKSYSRWYDYSRARDEMFAATDTAWAPWYVARSDDKRRARLNIIAHLLGKIPYKQLPREKIKLPKRQERGRLSRARLSVQVHPGEVLNGCPVRPLPARRRIPLLDWVANYRREWLGSDLVAGLTTAAVVIPKALAYATVAGLPIQVGLYTAFVPLIIYAVLGTSRPLSVTTSATLAILDRRGAWPSRARRGYVDTDPRHRAPHADGGGDADPGVCLASGLCRQLHL